MSKELENDLFQMCMAEYQRIEKQLGATEARRRILRTLLETATGFIDPASKGTTEPVARELLRPLYGLVQERIVDVEEAYRSNPDHYETLVVMAKVRDLLSNPWWLDPLNTDKK